MNVCFLLSALVSRLVAEWPVKACFLVPVTICRLSEDFSYSFLTLLCFFGNVRPAKAESVSSASGQAAHGLWALLSRIC